MSRPAWPQRLGNLVREQIVRLFGLTSSRSGWAQRIAVALLVVTVIALGARSENRRATAEVGIIDGNTWLTSRSTQEVLLVNSATGEVTARTKLESPGEEENQLIIGRTVGNDAVVLEAASGNMSVISGATLEPIVAVNVPGAVGADQLLAAGDLVHVVNSTSASGFTLDRSNLFVVGSFAFPSGSTAAITRSGELWIASPRLGGVEGALGNVRVSGANESTTYLIGDAGDVPGLTTLGDEAIVLNRSTGRITYPESGRKVEVCESDIDLNRVMVVAVADVALDTELLVLINPITGRISGTDLDTGDCVPLEDIGDGPWGRPVSNGRFLYVAQSSEGVVAAIDTSNTDVRIIQSVAPNGDLDLLVDDGAVWFNDLDGPDAGLFSGLDIAMRTRKYAVSADKPSPEAGDRLSLTPDPDAPNADAGNVSEDEDPNGLAVGPALDGESSTIMPNFDGLPAVNSTRSGTAVADSAEATSSVGGLEPLPKVERSESEGARTIGLTGETTSTSPADAAVAPSSSVTSAPAGNRPAVTTSDIGAAPADTLQPVPTAGSPDATAGSVDDSFTGTFDATFEYDPDTNVALGDEVVFEAKAGGADDRDVDYTWDFGDGSSAIGRNISHSWSEPGDFLVTMTARSNERTAVDSKWFTVFERDAGRPPAANFTYSAVEASPGGRIEFSDSSTGEPTAWRWDFGDGTAGIGQLVSHTWSAPARYRVTLTVSNDYGSDSTSVQVIVGEPIAAPKALILALPQPVSVGETITFRAVGANNRTTNISWDFGDGTRGQGFEIEHVYEGSGPKRVVLTLVNPSGRSQDVEEVLVTPRPSATTSAIEPVQPAETVPTTEAPAPIAESSLPTVPALPADEQSTQSTAPPTSTTTDETVPSSTSQSSTSQSSVEPIETTTAPSTTGATTTTPQAPSTTAPSTTAPSTTAPSTTVPSTTVPRIERPEVPQPTSTTTTRRTTTTRAPATTTTTTARPTTTTTRPPSTTTVRPTTTTTAPPTTTTSAKATTTATPPTTRPATTTTQDAVPSDAIGDVAGDHQVEVGELVQFVSESTGSYEWLVWTFGDGNQSTDTNPTHRYDKPGVYWASVTVGNGSQTEDSDPVRVEVVPASNNNTSATSPLTIDPNPVEVGQAVRFINDAVGDIIVTKWVVDGQELRATGDRFVWHTFNSPGSRVVRMELCEASNVSNCWFVTADVEVLPDPNKDADQTRQKDNNGVTVAWQMDDGADATTIIAGTPVTFVDISDPRPLALEWEIEGRNSTDRSATFTFDQPGDISFRLTVITNDGRTAVMDRTLTVVGIDGPTARIEAPSVAQAGETVYLADISPGSAKGRTWEFGDDETSFDQRPEHVFWTPGTYTVLLTVWNDFGNSSAEHTIEIYE